MVKCNTIFFVVVKTTVLSFKVLKICVTCLITVQSNTCRMQHSKPIWITYLLSEISFFQTQNFFEKYCIRRHNGLEYLISIDMFDP